MLERFHAMTRESWLYYSGRLTEVRDVAAAMELYREILATEAEQDSEVEDFVSMLHMKMGALGLFAEMSARMEAYSAATARPDRTHGADRAQDGSAPRPGEALAWSEPAPAGRASRKMR